MKPSSFFKCLFLLIALFLPTTVLLAQEGTAPEPLGFEVVFATFVSLVALVPVVVEFAKTLLKVTPATPSWAVQALSWVVGLALTMFGWALQLGFLAGIPWYWALGYGFGASLAANGIADTKIIEWIFTLFRKK